jgi:2-dehydropantoate 2-reductase
LISEKLKIPTIGIGAGKYTSGQVLVYHDLLGIYPNFTPKFCKKYTNLSKTIEQSIKNFKEEVKEGEFPSKENIYTMDESEFIKAFPEEKLESQRISKKLNIAIIGGGNMGSLIGGRIASSKKHNVWIITNYEEHIQEIQKQNGEIKIKNLDETVESIKINTTSDINEMLKKCKADVIIYLTKSTKTEESCIKTKGLLKENGIVITLQNGMGNKEVLEKYYKKENIVVGVTYLAGKIRETGQVDQTGYGITTFSASPFKNTIEEIFMNSKLEINFVKDLNNLLWSKLIVNSAINPVTAINNCKNGELLEETDDGERLRGLIQNLVHESVNIAIKNGFKIESMPFPYQNVLDVCNKTKDNESSMLQDKLKNLETEIEYINGIIIEQGKLLGIPTPYNNHVYQKLSKKI